MPQVVWTLKLYAEACLNRAVYERENNHEELARRYASWRSPSIPASVTRTCRTSRPIEDQLKRELRRFEQAREDLAAGRFPGWY